MSLTLILRKLFLMGHLVVPTIAPRDDAQVNSQDGRKCIYLLRIAFIDVRPFCEILLLYVRGMED